MNPSELKDWILSKEYKKSENKMKAPVLNTTSFDEYIAAMFSLEALYARNIAPQVNSVLSYLPSFIT